MAKIISSIDVGTSKIVCLMATVNADNKICIKSASIHESAGIKNGNIVDLDSAIQAVFNARLKAEKFIGHEIDVLAVNLSGSLIKSKNIKSTLKVSHSSKISKRDILTLAKSLENDLVKNKKIPIHLMVNRSLVDGEEVKNPVGINGNSLEIDFYALYADSVKFNNISSCFKKNNLKVDNYVFSGFASALSVLNDQEKQNGALVIDMGAGLTSFSIIKNNRLILGHSIPIAGNSITKDISSILNINFPLAEKVKILNTNFYLDEEEENEIIKIDIDSDDSFRIAKNTKGTINDIAKARIEEIINLIFDFLNKKKMINVFSSIVLTGGVANIFGLDNFVGDLTKIKTRIGINNDVYVASNLDEKKIMGPNYSTSIGMLYFLNSFYKNNKVENYKDNKSLFNKIINFLVNLFIA